MSRVISVLVAVAVVASPGAGQDEAAQDVTPHDGAAQDVTPPEPAASTEEGGTADAAVRPRTALRTEAILPPPPRRAPDVEPDPELTEDFQLPPPELEWRLRLGVGASASTNGTGDLLSLRLTQEIEWMPTEAAPFLFGVSGGELIGALNIYLASVRLGAWARFCEDRIVVCTAAIAFRVGATFGGGGPQFDLGGDADARFRFDGVELGIRLGFFVVSGVTYVDALGMVGAAL